MIGRRGFIAGGSALAATLSAAPASAQNQGPADLILVNGKIATMDPRRPSATTIAISRGTIVAAGSSSVAVPFRGMSTQVIDLNGRTVVPGLNDSHVHGIREGLTYTTEVYWSGVPSLADGLRLIREKAQHTGPPQWVRVLDGWSPYQFAEARLPSLAEINAAAPETPVFVKYLYLQGWLNAAAVRALGYTKDTPNPPGGIIERDAAGTPTGLLIAKPSAAVLNAALSGGPKLSRADQRTSTQLFLAELSRFGLTSAFDAGGGAHVYPEDYAAVEELAHAGRLPVRLAYSLNGRTAGKALDDFKTWLAGKKSGDGSAFLRLIGTGEILSPATYDGSNFVEPAPVLPPGMEAELSAFVTWFAQNGWPFRVHLPYDHDITRFLAVFEDVNRTAPIGGLRWIVDHAEGISERNIDRVLALGGSFGIQNRMAAAGETYAERYGAQAGHAPPLRAMLKAGATIGAGTDGAAVSSYNPWHSLHWFITRKTLGGRRLADAERIDRATALRLYTLGSAHLTHEEAQKGTLAPGKLADIAVLSADYFAVPEDDIKNIESLMTIAGGTIVHASGPFAALAPPPIPRAAAWTSEPETARRAPGGANHCGCA